MRKYTSLKELNKDLKYYKLKSQIDQEELKLTINRTQESAKKIFSPVNFIIKTAGTILQETIVIKILDNLLSHRKTEEKE